MALDFPASPTNGQVFGSYIWSASKGVWQSREESAAPAVVSPVPPTTPNPGDIWVDSSDGVSYVYYDDGSSGQWIEMISSGVPQLNTKADKTYVDQQDALKANLTGGNSFTETQTFGTPIGITSGGTGGNSLATAQANLQIPLSPNYIINGAMDIWQRGASITVPASTWTWTSDRWKGLNTGGSTTCSRESSIVPSFAQYSYKMTQAGSAATVFAIQTIETSNAIQLADKTVTLSGYFAASSSTTVTVDIAYSTNVDNGTEAAWTGYLTAVSGGSGTVSSTASFTRVSGIYSIPANAKSLQVRVWSPSLTVGTSLYFCGIQLEQGSVATMFRRNANSIQGELAACQRYFIAFGSSKANNNVFYYASGSMYQATLGIASLVFPVEMRTTPTLSFSAASTFQSLSSGANLGISSIYQGDSSQNVAGVHITTSTAVGSGAGISLRSNGVASFIHASAEL